MSLFGEALPYEDDTAASLIRRTGYPPEGKYVQMPENYVCPCCKEFSEAQERERLIIAAQQEKEKEKRRLMQLDVFDERAKPLPTNNGNRRKIYRRVDEEDTLAQQQPEVPPPPPTLDELRRQKKQEASPAKLIVTVHYGKNLEATPKDPMSVIVRCGAFEGQTAKVQRGKGNITTWDELFEFPYPNSNENLEVLVVNDALPEANDHLLGGVVVPSNALHDTNRGDEESLPVYPENEMQTGFDKSKEGPLGAVVVSWYVSEDGKEQLNESALDDQNLKQPLECVFVAHRVFQYTDNGSEPYPGGVLCVLRDTDDNCSDSILYLPGSNMEPSLSPYYGKEGYHYLPENPSQMMQLNTEKKLGHILVCVPKQESAPNQEEEEELFVVGAVPIDFEKLYHKGNAVLLIESKSMDDALWGEISIEWLNRSLDSDRKPPIVDVDNESLYVTVVRGLNLTNGEKEPVKEAYVSVAAGEMEGITVSAPSAVDAEQNSVITWNQEIRFIDVDPKEKNLEVVAFENGNPVSTGHVELDEDQDEGTVVIAMHDMHNDDDYRGEIIVNYKRLHVQQGEEATQQSDDHDEQREANESAADGDRASSGYNDQAAYQDNDEQHTDDQNENDEDADDRQSRDLKEAESAHEEEEGDDEGEEQNVHERDEQNDDSSAEEDKEEDHDDQREYEKNEEESSHHAGSEDEEQKEDAEHNDDDHDDEEETKDREHEEDEDEDHQRHEEEEEEENKHDSDNEDNEAHSNHDDEEEQHDEDHESKEEENEDNESEQKDRDVSSEHEDENAQKAEESEGHDSDKDKEDNEENEDDEYHELYDKDEDHNKDDEDEGHSGHEEEHHDDKDRAGADDNDEEEKDNANRNDEDDDGAYHDHDGEEDAKDAEEEENDDEDAHRGNSAEGSDHDRANENGEEEEEDDRHGEDEDEEGRQSDHAHDDAEHDDDDEDKDEDEDAADQHDGHEEEGDDTADHNRDLDNEHDQDEEDAAHAGNDDEEAAHQEEPAQEAEGDESHPDDHHNKHAEEEEHDVVDDNATDMALGDAKRGKSPSKRPNWSDKRTSTSYKKPWYPAGQPTNENHLPYEKTKRSKSTRESIRNLETRRTRLEEESVRRASTPRSSLASPHVQQ